jgi:hypothetical protein
MASGIDIYEKYIQPLSDEEKRQIAALLEAETGNKDQSLMDLQGLGKEIWTNIATDEYVESIRED